MDSTFCAKPDEVHRSKIALFNHLVGGGKHVGPTLGPAAIAVSSVGDQSRLRSGEK